MKFSVKNTNHFELITLNFNFSQSGFILYFVNKALSDSTLCFFLSYAYDSIFVDHEFDYIFRTTNVSQGREARSIIKSVTQQFMKPFDCIPEGWKTICLIEFPDGIPDLIKELPIVENWFESASELHICLSNKQTWKLLQTTGYRNLSEFWRDYNVEKTKDEVV